MFFFKSEIAFVMSLLKTGTCVFGFDDARREFHMFVQSECRLHRDLHPRLSERHEVAT